MPRHKPSRIVKRLSAEFDDFVSMTGNQYIETLPDRVGKIKLIDSVVAAACEGTDTGKVGAISRITGM